MQSNDTSRSSKSATDQGPPGPPGEIALPRGPLPAGRIVAGRFRVVGLLGSGGMGEVYSADDEVLDERVAIKVVHSQVTDLEEARQRLRREVQMARKVTHPNVCRVFDLFHHPLGDGLGLDVISMELLHGRSLRQLLETEGRLPEGEALQVALQVAKGLHAAHRLGIVHRDLKPSNIMLVEEESGPRVSITDFGLARFHDLPVDASRLTQTGDMLGSPAYMSPEQVQGDALSPTSDIYAFGIILYELLSGTLPFDGPNPLQVAVSRLQQTPRPLVELQPDLRPEVARFVGRCLQTDPSLRPQSTLDILEFLESINADDQNLERATWRNGGSRADHAKGEDPPVGRPLTATVPMSDTMPSVAVPPSSPSQRSPWRPSVWWIAALPIALLWWSFSGEGPEPSTAAPPATENAPSAPLSAPPFTQSPSTLEERVAQLLDGQLRDMESIQGRPAASETADPEAHRSAALHLGHLDGAAALAALEEPLDRHPEDAFLLAQRAEALWRLGQDDEALEVALTAVAFSGGLGATKPLPVDALYFGLMGQWQQAREVLHQRFIGQGPNLDIGLRMIEANWLFGQNDPMEDLFTTLRDLPEAGEDLRLDLWQGRVAHSQGHYEQQEELARRVIAGSLAPEKRFLHLEGKLDLVEALGRLGRLDEAQSHMQDIWELADGSASPLYAAHASRAGGRLFKRRGQASEALASLRAAAGQYAELGSLWGSCLSHKLLGYASTTNLLRNPAAALDEGIQALERGIDICHWGGFREKEALAKLSLGRARRDRGQFDEAMTLFQESARQLAALGNHRHQAQTRLGLALLLGRLGRTDEMLTALEASESWQRRFSDRGELVKVLEARAWGLIAAGRLDEAKTTFAEVEELVYTSTQLLDLLELRGEVAWAEADGSQLRRIADDLESLASSLGRADVVATSQRLAAQAHILNRELDRGLAELAQLDAPRAKLLQAEVLVDLGRHGEAAQVLKVSRAHIAGLEERHKDWRLEILEVLLHTDRDVDHAQSLQRLRAIEHAAVRKGHLYAATRARLSIGILEKNQSMLQAVEAECRRSGFQHLANRARHAIQTLTPAAPTN